MLLLHSTNPPLRTARLMLLRFYHIGSPTLLVPSTLCPSSPFMPILFDITQRPAPSQKLPPCPAPHSSPPFWFLALLCNTNFTFFHIVTISPKLHISNSKIQQVRKSESYLITSVQNLDKTSLSGCELTFLKKIIPSGVTIHTFCCRNINLSGHEVIGWMVSDGASSPCAFWNCQVSLELPFSDWGMCTLRVYAGNVRSYGVHLLDRLEDQICLMIWGRKWNVK